MTPHEPLQITVWLRAPVSLNHPWIHFDGIVAHLIYRRVLGSRYYELPTKRVQHLDDRAKGPYVDLLRRQGELFHASVSQFGPQPRYGTIQYFKRFEGRFAPGRLRRIERGHGPLRDWMLRTVYVSAQWCRFYCCARRGLLEDLLTDLWGLGNDTRIGWGRVHHIEVEPIPQCRCLVVDGIAMRPIPVRLLASYDDAVALAWRPPYWARESVELCAPPGARVELARELASLLPRP